MQKASRHPAMLFFCTESELPLYALKIPEHHKKSPIIHEYHNSPGSILNTGLIAGAGSLSDSLIGDWLKRGRRKTRM